MVDGVVTATAIDHLVADPTEDMVDGVVTATAIGPLVADQTEDMVDGVVTARAIDHLVDSGFMCWSGCGRQMFTELHGEANVSGNALDCPVHELVGAWEAMPYPLQSAAQGSELFPELHDRGHFETKVHRVQALGVELAVSGTKVSVYDVAALLDGLSSSVTGGLQSAELHPTQVRGGSADTGQMDALAIIAAYSQDGLTGYIWGAWAFCTIFMLLVIGVHLRKWDPGGLCSLSGFAGVELRRLLLTIAAWVSSMSRPLTEEEARAPQLRRRGYISPKDVRKYFGTSCFTAPVDC
ncbi:unnamed protein product, partial [Symbiodinium sp. CCMP2456]